MSSAIQIFKKTVRASSGTQSNELAAKIKSVTSSTTIGAVFIYDTRNDSDSGAWRKKARGSWYYEDLNTATRGGRREFPSVALIVADDGDPDGTARTITIYDLDDVAAPMWMVFQADSNDGSKFIWNSAGADATGIAALNGQVYISVAGGGFDKLIKFADDELVNVVGAASPGSRISGPIANRNATGYTSWGDIPAYWINQLVNSTSNDCAMTVLEGAEIGALGLPIPTVAVACGTGSSGGLSVIHPNGDVYDKATTSAPAQKVEFDKDGNLYAGQGQYISRFDLSTLYADASNVYLNVYENNGTLVTIREFANASIPSLVGNTDSLAITDNGFAGGSSSGLTQVKFNDGNHEESAVAFVTSSYNSGYQLGDIRFAGLANNKVTDRSVKANTLTQNGSVGSADVATGAELKAYNSFSASNYLSRADADLGTTLDFGTGDFSVMFWVKSAATGSYEDYISRADASLETGDWLVEKQNNEKIIWYRYNGSSWDAILTSSGSIGSEWQQLVAVRRSGRMNWYINGKLDSSATDANSYTPSGGSALVIGRRLDTAAPATNASLSLVRISATAPTPQQVKEIYEAEKPLFRAGAKCLLYANTVKDLAYDNSTGLLSVGQNATSGNDGVVNFRGLEKVSSFQADDYSDWSGNTSHKLAAAGGVSAYARTSGTGGVLVDLPAIDVRGDINTADSKLPDDGKLHFTGVTTDATPTVIGNIPIAENERYTVSAKVVGQVYNDNDNSYIDVVEEKICYREAGSNVGVRASSYKMTDANHASFDVEIVQTTGGSDSPASITSASNLIMIKVTGKSASPSRIVWNATVEVQRISEKTYER